MASKEAVTPRTLAEVERALRDVPWIHEDWCRQECDGRVCSGCAGLGGPDYPALAAQVWAWLEETQQERDRYFQAHSDLYVRLMAAQEENAKLRDEVGRLRDRLEMAWGIIANAGGGNWTLETKEWQRAAARWRDDYFAALAPAEGPEETP